MRAQSVETSHRAEKKKAVTPEVTPGRREIGHMLAAFAQALSLGDGRAVAALWEVPALLISDEGTRAVSSLDEVAMFFEGASKDYLARGVFGTRPEIQRLAWVTDRIVSVTVRWPHLSADGRELGRAESSTYILRRNQQEQLRVVAVIAMGVEPESS